MAVTLKYDFETAQLLNKCPVCGEDLPAGSNESMIFCKLRCKNKYHNHKLGPGGQAVKRISKILNTNRLVLKDTLGEKTTLTFTMPKLIARGFDDTYHTHIKYSGGKTYYFSFDFGYRDDGNGDIKVVKDFDRV